jgi:hypothetical protein
VSAIALTGGGAAADLDAGIERAARSLSRLVLRRLGSGGRHDRAWRDGGVAA